MSLPATAVAVVAEALTLKPPADAVVAAIVVVAALAEKVDCREVEEGLELEGRVDGEALVVKTVVGEDVANGSSANKLHIKHVLN